MRLYRHLVALLFISTVFCSASTAFADQKAPKDQITVFAAASLSDTLPLVAAAWQKAGGSEVLFSFDATSRLAKQISQGAPADVFFSADDEWMDFLAEKDLIRSETRYRLLTNELVIITGNGKNSHFSFKGNEKLALAGENVPAGKYAAAALAASGHWNSVQPRIVRGDNVRTVLAWTASGDVPAGIVYKTDALSIPDKVRIVHTFPPQTHPVISYPAAVVKKSLKQEQASAFVLFCRSAAATEIFAKAGFKIAPGT